jgi:hypothetical protein
VNGRRGKERRMCSSPVEIWGGTVDGKAIYELALIEDRSSAGMGLSVHASFPLGSTVKGEVRSPTIFRDYPTLHAGGLWL